MTTNDELAREARRYTSDILLVLKEVAEDRKASTASRKRAQAELNVRVQQFQQQLRDPGAAADIRMTAAAALKAVGL